MLFVALCRAAACVILLAALASAHAQQWPTRAIRVVSPFPAGSASDSVSRVVVDELSRLLGQPVVIETRAGGGGSVGFAFVARADPDGYTFVATSSSMSTEVVLHRKLAYDPLNDFAHTVLIGTSPNVLVASSQRGFRTVADLVTVAKSKPGELTFASAGIGSSSHMAAERFRLAANVDVRHIPFREGRLTEVMAGRINYPLPSARGVSLGAAQRQGESPRGKLTQARLGSAGCAFDRRSRIPKRAVPVLEWIIGAGKNRRRR